ncbi:hypothetical protein H4696_008651 [Amycolatopsis lexingtonensis]|uniref:Small secreted protein n=1 Tax=Amycolatopsis lexingtonensis TaxID=218822 RepID=A0ABR9IEE5_9PSEU|nr:hypothetical protein [Amycolatopsis lexingtonensis]MBE1501551.1 hypothetical protein [Amycolatopsis lexingtonensis]
MKRMHSAVLAMAATALLSCAACGSEAPADPGRHADPAALAWVDKVCTGVAAGSAKLAQPPAVDNADPVKTRDAMVDFLTRLGSALDDMAGGIRGAGVPPVPDGQSAVDKATGNLTETKAKVGETKTKMEQAKVTDDASLRKVISEADATMGQLADPEGPIKDLKANPELDLAFSESATCKRVYGSGA